MTDRDAVIEAVSHLAVTKEMSDAALRWRIEELYKRLSSHLMRERK